jgi:hypothetical protein
LNFTHKKSLPTDENRCRSGVIFTKRRMTRWQQEH